MQTQFFTEIYWSLIQTWEKVDLVSKLALATEKDALAKLEAVYKEHYQRQVNGCEWQGVTDRAAYQLRIEKSFEHIHPDKLISRATPIYQVAVEMSAFVLAHTVLEDHVNQALDLSTRLAPSLWLPFIDKKKIDIRTLIDLGAEDSIRQKAGEALSETKNQSLPKRFERLILLSQGTGVPNDQVQPDLPLLNRLDQRRHALVHGTVELARNFMPVDMAVGSFLVCGTNLLKYVACGHSQTWCSWSPYLPSSAPHELLRYL